MDYFQIIRDGFDGKPCHLDGVDLTLDVGRRWTSDRTYPALAFQERLANLGIARKRCQGGHMLRLRPEQMTQFADAAQLDFTHKMVEHLRHAFPHRFQESPDDELFAIADARVKQALKLGLTTRGNARRYLEASIDQSWPEIGPSPEAVHILRLADLTPAERMDRVEQRRFQD